MNGVDKIMLDLSGRPLLSYAVRAFEESPKIDRIVLVLSEQNQTAGKGLVASEGWRKVVGVCTGGARRQDSVRNGIAMLGDVEWTIVHDGARPFIDGPMIARGLAEAARTGASVAGVPVKDTIKRVSAERVVTETVPRDGLWSIQTPQVFRTAILRDAHARVPEDVTDDASMVERAGGAVTIFDGSPDNIKVTTPEDIAIAGAILKARSERAPA
ncbi:MAG: 2-C-methyl-D-erythritol 4-phosphate cytidylyltransferase [SAR202 cluster bacterium]|nr:2-C-methyl-D-erythritol 4-phosphate cytidylyltransferase [SAR202 cluster bacterium]